VPFWKYEQQMLRMEQLLNSKQDECNLKDVRLRRLESLEADNIALRADKNALLKQIDHLKGLKL